MIFAGESLESLTKYLAVAAAGALGAVVRFFLGELISTRFVRAFPLATFVINVTGSFLLGFFLTLTSEKISVSHHLKAAVAVGFIGAYTTFSTFEYETAKLIEIKEHWLALLYVGASLAAGLCAVWAGTWAARLAGDVV